MPKTINIATSTDAMELAARLHGHFATIVMRTDQKSNIKAAHRGELGDVYKVSKVSVQCGIQYANAVENTRKREGVAVEGEKFAAKKTWGEQIGKTTLVEHKGSIYLACKPTKVLESHFEDAEGNIIADELVRPYMYVRKQPKTQGTEKAVLWIKPKISSILSISAMGETYVIAENIELMKSLLFLANQAS